MVSSFYIYVDGSDLKAIANDLRARIEAFVEPYGSRVRVVDQCKVGSSGSDLPDWDLGVNFEVNSLSDDEKRDVALFFQMLSGEFGRDFVLGGVLPHGLTDDFVTISAGAPLDRAIDVLVGNRENG